MKAHLFRFALPAFCLMAAQLPGQQPVAEPAGPSYYQTSSYIKVAPIFEERIKRGEMSGWNYSTKLLPSGSETAYSARTADVFPTWEAAFKTLSSGRELFTKVHPGKKFEETMGNMSKMRDHAKRELWVVVERVEKKK